MDTLRGSELFVFCALLKLVTAFTGLFVILFVWWSVSTTLDCFPFGSFRLYSRASVVYVCICYVPASRDNGVRNNIGSRLWLSSGISNCEWIGDQNTYPYPCVLLVRGRVSGIQCECTRQPCLIFFLPLGSMRPCCQSPGVTLARIVVIPPFWLAMRIVQPAYSMIRSTT
ncbi:hypothetical protein ASPBRDRAFT_506075 [Aspergillus brasiliensis CBS 101740]|uniref:Uncharacterized protein n=1 Tax=Aspergillus brasiliensis (strain CBS 101740 / IMI 381727 / IBT 21946) TaxID=767769 RepID=A0A1L9UP97_ASPBC|nr:hypothetical protein ASPBRDRAFT_506075 [Aspergillus brasiliensis CBS 101740]